MVRYMSKDVQDPFKELKTCDISVNADDGSDVSFGAPKISVLLVDDKKLVGKMVERMLKSQKDIEFHFCQSAREAMKVADDICPTVILQDLVMPEIDGLYMVEYFRSRYNTRDTPLIVLSAEEDAKVKAKAFSLGANDYIVKLPDKIELIARIRYHSQAYINMLQRNAAYEALHESKKKAERERETAEAARKKIMASIRYAKMIQTSLLPNPENIKSFIPDSFFIWMPRDIVGGDFIYVDSFEDGFVIAVIDCTGHGVPGAFMTMIASFGLRKIIRGEGFRDPAQILRRLNFLVKTTLQQDTDFALSDDGLDAAVCFIGQSSVVSRQLSVADSPQRTADNGQLTTCNLQLTFAGAKLPLIYVQDGEPAIIKGDRQSVGYKRSDTNFKFTSHTVDIREGTSFYMFSDGFVDQLGGEKRRRFGTRRFKNLLKDNAHLPFEEQRNILLGAFHKHKGEGERQDDVTVVGFGF